MFDYPHLVCCLDPDLLSVSKLAPSVHSFPANVQDGEFTRPNGVTVDEMGNIIVADSRNNRIQVGKLCKEICGSPLFLSSGSGCRHA